jgi:hypothetical protein
MPTAGGGPSDDINTSFSPADGSALDPNGKGHVRVAVNTHRRARVGDRLAYRQTDEAERKAALDELTQEAQPRNSWTRCDPRLSRRQQSESHACKVGDRRRRRISTAHKLVFVA